VGFAAFKVFWCQLPVDDEVSEFSSEDLLDKIGVDNRFSFLLVSGFGEPEPAAVVTMMEMCDYRRWRCAQPHKLKSRVPSVSVVDVDGSDTRLEPLMPDLRTLNAFISSVVRWPAIAFRCNSWSRWAMFIVAGTCAGAGSSILNTFQPSGPVRPDVPNAVSPKGLVVLESPVPGGGGGRSNCDVEQVLKPLPINEWPIGFGCEGRSVAVACCRAMAR
jgi:hypothetical protein